MAYISQKDTTANMIDLLYPKPSTKPAFTMLELVFVIVVIGILAVLSLSSMERDLRQEAADNILSDIRYTQQLAMTDNKHRFDDVRWERAYWRMIFSTCSGGGRYYMIGARDDRRRSVNGFFRRTQAALDPANGKPMWWRNRWNCDDGDPANNVSKRIFLTDNYGIINVVSGGGCSRAAHIAFDHWGRPYNGVFFTTSNPPDHAGYMTDDCTFTFTMSDGQNFTIQINQETGYAWIVNQNDS